MESNSSKPNKLLIFLLGSAHGKVSVEMDLLDTPTNIFTVVQLLEGRLYMF